VKSLIVEVSGRAFSTGASLDLKIDGHEYDYERG